MDENYCSNCGSKIDEDSMFCPECGSNLKKDLNFCPECGNKLKKESIYCVNCGFKLKEDVSNTKFCQNCGEKINKNAEICPHCGVRLMNPLANTAGDALNSLQKNVGDGLISASKYFTLKNVTIVVLVLIIIGLVVYSPAIIDYLTPYKEVDSSYIANPVAHEKVKFTGEYVGTTSWGSGLYYFYYPMTNNDILKVGDQYVILQGDYLGHDLYGNEGKKVHVEGRFVAEGLSNQKMGNGYIEGHWFGADTIKLIN